MWLIQVLISAREGTGLGAIGEVTDVTQNICLCAQGKTEVVGTVGETVGLDHQRGSHGADPHHEESNQQTRPDI